MAINFRQLAAAAPVMDEQAAKRAREAQQIQLAAELGKVQPQPGVSTTAAAQAVAPQVIQATGQAGLQAQQAQLGQTLDLAQQGLVEQEQTQRVGEARAELGQRTALAKQELKTGLDLTAAEEASKTQMTDKDLRFKEAFQRQGLSYDESLSFLTLKQREDLAKLGSDAKQQLFDARLAFDDSEQKRKFASEMQLLDYAVVASKSEEELKGRLQLMQQLHKKELIALEILNNEAKQMIANNFANMQQKLDFKSRQKIIEAQQEMEKKLAKKRRQGAYINTAISVAAIAATAYGGPAAGAAVQTGGTMAAEKAQE